jgi:hypothetical protein
MPEVYATWVAEDESGRDELTRVLVAFDSSDADIRETDGDHFAVISFPDDTDEERALAQASEIVRDAAEQAGVPQDSIELATGD